jgi:hypothetical protein
MDPFPAPGYIPAPAGTCAVGATPTVSFPNQNGEKIPPELVAEKDIQVIDFDTLTGRSIDGRTLQCTITCLITPGDQSLGTPAESLLDNPLWSDSWDNG